MSQRLPGESWICVCQFCDPTNMVHPVDVLCNPRCGDIPVIVLERVEIHQGNWDVPILAVRRAGFCQRCFLHFDLRKKGNSLSSKELNPSSGIDVSEYELRSSKSCSSTAGKGVCSGFAADKYAESSCHQLHDSAGSPTSALHSILAHFLTIGSNASKLLPASKTKHRFHIYSFL
jgi:hypothetical protein